MNFYAAGEAAALDALGIKEASMRTVLMRTRKDPFQEIHKRLQRAFNIKTPKFDMTALLKRMMNNPFGRVTKMLGGNLQPLRV